VRDDDAPRPPFARAYGVALVAAVLLLLSWTGQLVFELMTTPLAGRGIDADAVNRQVDTSL